MTRRRFAWFPAVSFCTLTLLWGAGIVRAQRPSAEKPPPAPRVTPTQILASKADLEDAAKRKALIDKMIAEYDLTPHPAPSIPDNPPPHESALVNLPVVVEPPDLLIVEVLEALPGRPISGERLVRPDGTISLGFYGDVSVKGLTLPQIKVAVIKQLRRFLTDELLGLEFTEEVEVAAEVDVPRPERPPIPPLPLNANPFNPDEGAKPVRKTSRPTSPAPRVRQANFAARRVPVRPVALGETDQDPAAGVESPKAPPQINIPAGASGRITITIDVGGPPQLVVPQMPVGVVPAMPPANVAVGESWKIASPDASDRVFIDVTGYNSRHYYIQGDVPIVGRMPFTGSETVLDALQFAGGLQATADPKHISLIRPQRNGKPAKVYKVDLEAIQSRGEVATNYQIFPGDRLLVGRNDVVTKTIEIDRLYAPIQTMNAMMLYQAFTFRALQFASVDHRDELLKEYVDFWMKALAGPGGVKFDEQTMREAFIRKMKLTPAPVTDNPRSPSIRFTIP
jgi:protein involved in polysaccharide export with SLBB domain